ncbi:non-ribosomal peptide synthetase domain-containing protein [Streptosporangium soli]|nr:hypothetical protein [Streptosporangium sp. KLBMP 9127]
MTTTSGALTWGQADLVNWVAAIGGDLAHLVMIRDLGPAGGAESAAVATSALRTLEARHAILRTRFSLDGQAGQTVDDDAGLDIRQASAPVAPAANLLRIHSRYLTGRATLVPESDPPICLLYRRPDERWGSLLVTSHLVVDGYGVARLAEEYQALVGGAPPTALPPAVAPLAVAELEASPRRQELSARNLAHMRADLTGAEPWQVVREPGSPATRTTARSATLKACVDRLSQLYDTPKGGVLTALITLLVARAYGFGTVLVRTLFRMPTPVRGATYIATNTLATVTPVRVDPGWTMERFMKESWASCVSSYRRCVYDPSSFDRMQRDVAESLGGTRVNGLVYLNYHVIPDLFDWNAEPRQETTNLDGFPDVYRTQFDVKESSGALTLVVDGVSWPRTGDTSAQVRALIDLAASCGDVHMSVGSAG